MIRRTSHVLAVCLTSAIVLTVARSAGAAGWLRTQGQDMVDETGNKVLLQGVGLGNWFLPEGYMWKFGQQGDRPRKIEKLVSDLIGPEDAEVFWRAFRRNYVTEADVQRIAELGFNSVRPALNARLFLTEGQNPTYVDEGFEILDNLVTWCRAHNLYVIIDMHAAPGGQTGANIDDSPNDKPELFSNKENQDRLVDLWVKIAERYRDESTVAAYDLLNEPLPERTGAAKKYSSELDPLYKRITAAIRKADKRHMITLEGANWANDWSVFSPKPFDDSVFYQFHYYCWNRPDNLNSIEKFLAQREILNTPIWVGETGEKDKAIYWATTQYFEANNIGWSFWPWKKMDTTNTPCSINKPSGWDAIADYSRGGDKPSRGLAKKAFEELLENIKLENCVYFPDVVGAIFRRVPGRVEAENYGHHGLGQSYFVKDVEHKASRYRTSEPVPIEPVGSERGRRRSAGQCVRLEQGEWTRYDIHCLKPQTCRVVVRAKAQSVPASLTFTANSQTTQRTLTEMDWTDVPIDSVVVPQGATAFRISVTNGTILFDWADFE